MRPVVLDTSVALPAVLSPRGYRRRFLVVLTLGALAARRELLRQETDTPCAEAASTGGQLGGAAVNLRPASETTDGRETWIGAALLELVDGAAMEARQPA